MLAHDQQPGPGRSGLSTALWAAALAAVVGFVSVYVTLGRPDNAGRPAVQASPQAERPLPAAPAGPGSNALSQGQMAAFVFKKQPEPLPEFTFQDAAGRERTLADWRGKVVLLNLWATWCLPCRKEMPALDRLQAEMASDRFEVVAVSVDRTGLQGARKFLDETKVGRLALYADPTCAPGINAACGRITGNAADRRRGSRDRPPAGPRRMGQRGRQAPDQGDGEVVPQRCARDRTPAAQSPSRPAAGRRRWSAPAARPCSDGRGR